jgi:aminoglycoside phosphotransferase (APT) family kinase protein
LIADSASDQSWLFVLEDLDAAGYSIRRNNVNQSQLTACLSWLANLHAAFISDTDDESSAALANEYQLWPTGTYWHLATRPDEFKAMPDGNLKQAAEAIDEELNNTRFKTIVHGDAKLANFCFSNRDTVAAVDFQYVGGGCGMKDIAYFISSCYEESECQQKEEMVLAIYFGELRQALRRAGHSSSDLSAIEEQWRRLYPFAWADFYRFLSGWSPGHRKMHRYSEKLTKDALSQL